KKDKREYEHRAPRAVVFRVAELLASSVLPGTPFAMDRLIPLKDSDGVDVPSYQVYLALAWFRSLGSVEQRGKEGYAILDGALDEVSLDQAWKRVDSRD